MCMQFCLDMWTEEDTIILDDFNIKFFPHWKAFFGNQKEHIVTDKYRKKKRVDGKLLIWLCNPDGDPRRVLSESELEWFNVNVVTIYLSDKLFMDP